MKYKWTVRLRNCYPAFRDWPPPDIAERRRRPVEVRHTLGVYVKYKHAAPLGFLFNNAMVSESTVMWIEPSFALICK